MKQLRKLDCDETFDLLTRCQSGVEINTLREAGSPRDQLATDKSQPASEEALANHLANCPECRELARQIAPSMSFISEVVSKSKEPASRSLEPTGSAPSIARLQPWLLASDRTQASLRERWMTWGSSETMLSSFGACAAILLLCIGGAFWLSQSMPDQVSKPTQQQPFTASLLLPTQEGSPSVAGRQRLIDLGLTTKCLEVISNGPTSGSGTSDSSANDESINLDLLAKLPEPQAARSHMSRPDIAQPHENSLNLACCTDCHRRGEEQMPSSPRLAGIIGQSCSLCHVMQR